MIKDEKKNVNGHIDIPEFSYGELDDLQVRSTFAYVVHGCGGEKSYTIHHCDCNFKELKICH